MALGLRWTMLKPKGPPASRVALPVYRPSATRVRTKLGAWSRPGGTVSATMTTEAVTGVDGGTLTWKTHRRRVERPGLAGAEERRRDHQSGAGVQGDGRSHAAADYSCARRARFPL